MEPITSLIDPLDPIDVEEEDEDRKPGTSRITALWIIVLLFVGVLVFQLYRIQIVQGADYRSQANNNRFRMTTIAAPRGVIYDREHDVLARNRPSYSVGIVPADLPVGNERTLVYERLATLLRTTPAKLATKGTVDAASQFSFVPLATNVSQQIAFEIEERHLELPGVHVEVEPIRQYPLGAITAPILGYVGRITNAQYQRLKDDPVHHYGRNDVVGQVGIEQTFEAQLRGRPGQEQMEVDATGRQVRTLGVQSPQPGTNLTLTIDGKLQQKIADTLNSGLARYKVASAVAIDPRNGQVLAMVSQPSYNDNLFAEGISQADYQRLLQDPRHPMLNQAISGAYPPGAVFDVVTAIAGLQTGVITPTTKLDCPGFISVPNRFDPTIGTRLYDAKAYGQQDVESALADSCNTFFYQVGGGDPSGKWDGLGIDRIAEYAHLVGFGNTSGIDLVGESGGFIPSIRWKRQALNQEWVPMDTYLTAVGQGYVTVTPLQMADLAAVIANGGTLYRPQLVLETRDAQDNVIAGFKPDVIRRLAVKPSYLNMVRQGMIDATGSGKTPMGTSYDGAAKQAAVPGMTVAGLTSSPQFGAPDANGKLATHGWFVGFAPADHPRIAVAVFLENGTGAGDAATIARQVFSFYLQKG